MLQQGLGHLSEREVAALEEYVRRVRREHSDQVLRVVLFGSKARGDADQGSDADLLVVVRDDERRAHRPIERLGTDISLKYGLVLSELIVGPRRYENYRRYRTPLYRSIEAEGIELWMNTSAS